MKRKTLLVSFLLVFSLLLVSCSGVELLSEWLAQEAQTTPQTAEQITTATAEPAPAQPVVIDSGLLANYQQALTEIYDGVNPSVVSIVAVTPRGGSQGSGFVWDLEGHVVTNNHVVAGATDIQLEFYDGTLVSAELVGSDPYSDLAVLRAADVSEDFLLPVQVADSDAVEVGELAIAIGNPFGLENTMTVGIVSAIGRTIPAGQTNPFGPSYSIPDVIQTDAPINPGNSGGVLVNDLGQVIGVTAAIESTSGANAGIGFVIPSNIVSRVIPVLIEEGEYQHPYLGITGTRLTPNLAEAMDLEPETRGALVIAVAEDGPAEDAGLQGSERQVEINGRQAAVGGDVIIAVDGEPIRDMDDLIAYLFNHTVVGDDVTLTILRDGEEMKIKATLEARPASDQVQQTTVSSGGRAYLGISGYTLTPAIKRSLDLPLDLNGVLVAEVRQGSPADEAGISAGSEEVEVQGETIMAGGDIIVGFDGQEVRSIQELILFLAMSQPDQEVELTILRDGEEMDVMVTLQEYPEE